MIEFSELLQSARLLILAKDLHGKYIYCSESFAKRLGTGSPNCYLGKTDFDVFPEASARSYQADNLKVLKGGMHINVLETFPTDFGTLSILTNRHPLKNKNNELIGIVVSGYDLTSTSQDTNRLQYDPIKNHYLFHTGTSSEYFTSREYSVFTFLIRGFSGSQIAKELSLSVRTIEQYIENIKLKLQCTSKFQITQTAVEMGIIPNFSLSLPTMVSNRK